MLRYVFAVALSFLVELNDEIWISYVSLLSNSKVSRKIPTRFHEGKAISIVIVSNLQVFLVGVPLLILLKGESSFSFFVRSIIIWMNDFTVLSLIFGNIIYSVHYAKESSEPELVKAAIGHAIQQYANNRGGSNEDRRSSDNPTKGSSQSSAPRSPAGGMRENDGFYDSHHSEQLQAESTEILLTRNGLETHDGLSETPLPRTMFSSSVSTYVQGNLTEEDKISKRSLLLISSVASNDAGDDDNKAEFEKATPQEQHITRLSWMSRGMAVLLRDDSASRLPEKADVSEGSLSSLPSVEQPAQEQQQQISLNPISETGSISTRGSSIATGTSVFHDEGTISSEITQKWSTADSSAARSSQRKGKSFAYPNPLVET